MPCIINFKIDEPNTPYNYYEHHSDEDSAKTPPHHEGDDPNNPNNLAMNWDRLENKLDAVAAARDLYPSSPSGSSLGGVSGDSDGGSSGKGSNSAKSKRALMKETEFKMLRKKHYNEMEALKSWRNKHDDDDDDDDGDDDDGNSMEL